MKGYENWSFRDRSFIWAIGLSLVWHFFWFFSITVVVAPKTKDKRKPEPVFVSLGAVLDDSMFRTLLEARPELSETFYRRLSDYQAPAELETQRIERYQPGSVIGLPYGAGTESAVGSLLDGAKAAPQYEILSRFRPATAGDDALLEGDVRARGVLSRPAEPERRRTAPGAFASETLEIEFSVDPDGAVNAAKVLLSSGNPESDILWTRYLKAWRFAPLEAGAERRDQKGRVRFRIGAETGETAP